MKLNRIKKSLLSLLLMLPISVWAQTYGIGLRAGVANTSFWGDPESLNRYEGTRQPLFGVLLYHQSTDRLGFQADVQYARRVVNLHRDGVFEDLNQFRFALNYVEVPVSVVVDVLPNRKTAPFLSVGPSVALLMGARTQAKYVTDENWREDNEDDSIRKVDLGVEIGTGFRFRTNARMWMLDARYHLGVLNLISTSNNPKRNAGLSLTLGVMF